MTQPGLHVIYDSSDATPPTKPEIDVVAVHGLNFKGNPEHPRKTWTKADKLWLKDFLPGRLSKPARVLLFAYNSSPVIGAAALSVDDHAKSLLQWLDLRRKDAPNRPLVFICHSLGGLVAKSALVEATLDPSYRRIVDATSLLVFFGTPHQGGNGASIGDVVSNIVRAALHTPNNDILDALKRNSTEATRRFEQSRHIFNKCLILNFYEGLPYGSMGIVVDKASATLNLPSAREKQIAMHADHSGICKFASAEDAQCELVLHSICSEVDRALAESQNVQQQNTYQTPFTLQGVPVSGNFINRPCEMSELELVLLPNHSDANDRCQKLFVLYGLGGVGKTQLAVNFARRHKDAFTAIFWLDGRSEDRIKYSIASCAERIPGGISTKVSLDTNEGIEATVAGVLAWLARPDNTHWLLIIDNVDLDYEKGDIPGAYDVRTYMPGDQGSVLITTRLSRLTQLGESKLLGKVDPDLSQRIFEKWYGKSLGDKHDNLLQALDGLPLALAQAASYLRETGLDPASYLQVYRQQWDKITNSSDFPLVDYKQGSIATTWLVSFKSIESKSSDAANILRLWAFLSNKGMWQGLFRLATKESNEWPEWIRTLGEDVVRFSNACGVLLRYSMIEVQDSRYSWYSMHPVVHQWALHVSGDESRKEFTRLALLFVGRIVPPQSFDNFWVLQQMILPHAEQCYRFVEGLYTDTEADEATVNETDNMGRLFFHQGKLKEAAVLFKLSLEAKRKLYPVDGLSTYDTLQRLADVRFESRQLNDAEKLYREALKGKTVAVGPTHLSTLYTLNALGILWVEQDRLFEAEGLFTRVLGGYRAQLVEDDIRIVGVLNNLANGYMARGKLAEAEKLYHVTLKGYEKHFGPENKALYNGWNNLGHLYQLQGKPQEAEIYTMKSLVGFRKALGPDHTYTLRALNNAANLYKLQGKLDLAEQTYEEALDGYKRVLGEHNTTTLGVVKNLGVVYSDLGKYTKAEEMLHRAVAGQEKILGRRHTNTLGILTNIAELYLVQGKLSEAEVICQEVLAVHKEIHGAVHMDTLDTVNSLALIYVSQGKYPQAEQLYNEAFAAYEASLGPNHIATLRVVNNLGNLYVDQGRYKEAEATFNRAKKSYTDVLGANHPSTLDVYHNLGVLYEAEGRYKEAQEMHQIALDGCIKELGWDSLSTLNALACLGTTYKCQGELDKAEAAYVKALEGYTRTLGIQHLATLKVVNNLGNLYLDRELLDEAEEMYTKALDGMGVALGPDHPSRFDVLTNLGVLYANQGKKELAKMKYQEAMDGYVGAFGENHPKVDRVKDNMARLEFIGEPDAEPATTEVTEKLGGIRGLGAKIHRRLGMTNGKDRAKSPNPSD